MCFNVSVGVGLLLTPWIPSPSYTAEVNEITPHGEHEDYDILSAEQIRGGNVYESVSVG